MIDTRDLDSYYPGYDEYCEPREDQGDEDFDIDAIIDERRLQEMEEVKKENELFKVIYSQREFGKFDITSYHTPLLEYIYKNDKSTYLAIKNTVIQSFENIEKKIKEESKWVKKKKKRNQLL